MNFGTPVPLLVGLILILGAVGLFFLDKLKPGYERSSDKVYSILLLISGVFLLAHLNMELLASFQQVMLVGMLTTLIINDISKRESNRNSSRPIEREGPPRRYDERPRRVYRAELDDWDAPGPRQPQIPSNREGYRGDGYYDDRYGPRPLEPRPGYDERRPPARLQPGQPGRPEERRFDSYSSERPDSRRPDTRTSERPDSFYSNPRYDGGGSPPPSNRPQRPSPRPLDSPVTAGNGAGHSMGGLPQPPRNSDTRNDRPPLNVRPRPVESTDGNYTDFRPAQPSDGNPEQNSDTPPPQPPANY
ncbi:MAG: Ycf66 family protein [Cyanobacteria bacterium J06636_28]